MIKSMTGYGKGEVISEQGTFTVEIRSVNHRYGEVSLRMPRGFMSLENDAKKVVAAILKRGKIDVFIQWEESQGGEFMLRVDVPTAKAYYDIFNQLNGELGIPGVIPLELILSQKGVVRDRGGVIDEELCSGQLLSTLQTALDAIDSMRKREGESLASDLIARRQQVAQWIGQIGERTPLVRDEYRQKLKTRLEQLLDGVELDGARLAQEVALMADRCDVTEELVRLASHFVQFDETLLLSEPVGRKLDFLMQEMNREVNTIGSKSSDAEITALVIRIKAEMEKMREQVQNIE
jgi:uncharacterized protein (TIGR00255 family)